MTRGRAWLLLAAALACGAMGPPQVSPVGLWRIVDQDTGARLGLARFHARDGKIFGRLEGGADGGPLTGLCTACGGDRHNQPRQGLEFIRDLAPAGDSFAGGSILDPDTGRVYGCEVRVIDGGRKLVVRGYLGLSLLGRSQTWIREAP